MKRPALSGAILGAALVVGLATVGTLALTAVLLDAPTADLMVMAGALLATGLLGIAIALGATRLFGRIGLQGQFVLLAAMGLALLVANVAAAAALMFLSTHDLRLLFVLVLYAAMATAGPLHIMARRASSRIEAVEAGAARIAGGELSARVAVRGSDEVARLAMEFNRMAEALERSIGMRDQVEAARRDLFASVSHDLRTPLSSIQVMVEALTDGVVTDEETRNRYLKTMSGELGRLSSLIDDLFELAKLDSGELKLRLETLSVDELVSEALDAFRPQVERASVRLVFQPDGHARPVVADPARLSRVLYNLLQNALRHTPGDGTITLRTRSAPGGIEIEVSDSGDGIAADDAPFVFDRFFRGEKSRSPEYGGSGLGLAIARSIVEAHGGRIWVDQAAPSGATVVFSLPENAPAAMPQLSQLA